jgi:hypothetical protein
MFDQLEAHIGGTEGRVLLVDDGTSEARERSRSLGAVGVRWSIPAQRSPQPDVWSGVALLVRDRQSVRRLATALPALGSSRRVWCWIEDCGNWSVAPVVRPHWPVLRDMRVQVSGTSGAGLVALEFSAVAPVRDVLVGVALGSSTERVMWPAGPVLGGPGDLVGRWAPASPASVRVEEVPGDLGALHLPPDVLLQDEPAVAGGAAAAPSAVHATTGRPIARVVVPGPASWSDLQPATSPLRGAARVRDLGELAFQPVDERVINPIGFERDWTEGVAPVEAGLRSPDEVDVRLRGGPRRIDVRAGLKDSDVRALRRAEGVELRWRGGHGPAEYVRFVAGLAMAGVPITRTVVPTWARPLLDAALVAVLESPADLGDRLTREEHSVRLRRAALAGHSTRGWRRRLARVQGLPEPQDPTISVVLASRRPEMVPFALRQIAKQQGVGGEVVLATHGFEPDDAIRRAMDDVPAWDLRVVPASADTPFGQVLNRAVGRTRGEVLVKMDDDDWYGPGFIADLLLARGYSGADVVGMPAEYFFLEQLWRTVRRPEVTERFAPTVAGATIMIERGTLTGIGGFRVAHRAVDAALLAAVHEGGGRIFRTQGLGLVVRRAVTGHTWNPALGAFLTRSRVSGQWHGFHPSALLDAPDQDRPRRDVALDRHFTGVSA